MKILTEKKQIYIAKRLAAIYYIAVHGFGESKDKDIASMSKIVEHVSDIAWSVGGEIYADITVPSLVYDLQEKLKHRKDGAT